MSIVISEETRAQLAGVLARLDSPVKLIFSRNLENALATIRLWCKDANVGLVDVLNVTDSDRGEGARNWKELLTKAYEIGTSLNR
jgi:hypothetical protein